MYYYPTEANNWSTINATNGGWAPLPGGRILPNATCVAPFETELGKAGIYRMVFVFYHAMLPPVLMLLVLKVISRLCLYMPWMASTRKRNLKLQRMAAKRKAEVRRMTEGGKAVFSIGGLMFLVLYVRSSLSDTSILARV